MTELGYSQRELGRRTEIPHSAISNYLSGKTVPSLEAIDKLAWVLETPIADLLREKAIAPTRRASDLRQSPARQRLIEIINHCDEDQVTIIYKAIEILTAKRQDGASEEF